MSTKPLVFISHITEERDLALLIKDQIIEGFLLGSVDVFVSSDSRVNSGGQSWLKNIEDALQKASVFLILTSPNSVSRPWISIEAGAGWLRLLQAHTTGGEVPVMPLCHSGQSVSGLPKPWDTLNAVPCNAVSGLQEILNVVGRIAGLTKIPRPNFDNVLAEVVKLENKYSYFSKIEAAIKNIILVAPIFRPLFLGVLQADSLYESGELPMNEIEALRRPIQYLTAEAILIGGNSGWTVERSGGPDGGRFGGLSLGVTKKYISNIRSHISIN